MIEMVLSLFPTINGLSTNNILLAMRHHNITCHNNIVSNQFLNDFGKTVDILYNYRVFYSL